MAINARTEADNTLSGMPHMSEKCAYSMYNPRKYLKCINICKLLLHKLLKQIRTATRVFG